jgi:hypothetical protein
VNLAGPVTAAAVNCPDGLVVADLTTTFVRSHQFVWLAGANSSTDLGRSAHWSAQVADLGWSSRGFVSTRLLGDSRSTPCVNPESGQWIYWSETVKLFLDIRGSWLEANSLYASFGASHPHRLMSDCWTLEQVTRGSRANWPTPYRRGPASRAGTSTIRRRTSSVYASHSSSLTLTTEQPDDTLAGY